MKRIVFLLLLCLTIGLSTSVQAQSVPQYYTQGNNATITFSNKSGYSMVVKIIGYYGGLYQTVNLPPHTSKTVSFSKSATYKTKIKATHNGHTSYHKGGNFSVTCTETEWTEGEMSFQMSTYGSGLGPSISSKEFENNN
jgi:uncharacterized protein RhaS with RHS repeats